MTSKLNLAPTVFVFLKTVHFILQCRSNRKNSTINGLSHTKWFEQQPLETKEYQSNQVKREEAKNIFLKNLKYIVPDVILEK